VRAGAGGDSGRFSWGPETRVEASVVLPLPESSHHASPHARHSSHRQPPTPNPKPRCTAVIPPAAAAGVEHPTTPRSHAATAGAHLAAVKAAGTAATSPAAASSTWSSTRQDSRAELAPCACVCVLVRLLGFGFGFGFGFDFDFGFKFGFEVKGLGLRFKAYGLRLGLALVCVWD